MAPDTVTQQLRKAQHVVVLTGAGASAGKQVGDAWYRSETGFSLR